jgi:hypothetical protein
VCPCASNQITRVGEAVLADRAGNQRHLGFAVDPSIPRERDESTHRLVLDAEAKARHPLARGAIHLRTLSTHPFFTCLAAAPASPRGYATAGPPSVILSSISRAPRHAMLAPDILQH